MKKWEGGMREADLRDRDKARWEEEGREDNLVRQGENGEKGS